MKFDKYQAEAKGKWGKCWLFFGGRGICCEIMCERVQDHTICE